MKDWSWLISRSLSLEMFVAVVAVRLVVAFVVPTETLLVEDSYYIPWAQTPSAEGNWLLDNSTVVVAAVVELAVALIVVALVAVAMDY